MKISVKLDSSLENLLTVDLDKPIEKALLQATLMIQNDSKVNAPYDTGSLRRSITSDFSNIRQGMTIVGSPLPYATRRHYENYKNPHTLLYLERARDDNAARIKRIFKDALSKSIK